MNHLFMSVNGEDILASIERWTEKLNSLSHSFQSDDEAKKLINAVKQNVL